MFEAIVLDCSGELGDCIGLQRARSGAGRVAVDSRIVCTTLYVWVLCNLRPDTVTHL